MDGIDMNGAAAYTVFLAFGIVWIAMGAAAVIALLKADNQQIKFGKWGLLVSLTILLPFAVALIIAAVMSQTNFTFL
jgi:uncharacterized membrane protein HdeD (DUF308 family)